MSNNIDLSLCGVNIHIRNNDLELDLQACDSKLVIDDGHIIYNGQQIGDNCSGQHRVEINCGCDNNNNNICNCGCSGC